MSALKKRLIEVRCNTLKPQPKITLVEWADSKRYLPQGKSANPGPWRTSLVEVARGPMLAVTEKRVRKITCVTCTQILKTELLNNIAGFFMDQDPSPIIVLQPKTGAAAEWSIERLTPMIESTPDLAAKISPRGKKNSDNKILYKEFPGGFIAAVGANAPGDLASRPARVALCDEVDKYPFSSGREGDPIKLIAERLDTFWNSLEVHVCSPTIDGQSRIWAEYEKSDMRVPEVSCLYCDGWVQLEWPLVDFQNRDPKTAGIICPHCKTKWSEIDRLKVLNQDRLRWRATKPFNGHAGFRVNKLYSPFTTLEKLVEKFLESKEDTEQFKTFVNTQLAETWKIKGDSPEWRNLYNRRERYEKNTVPKKAVFLTAAVDVQKTRFEVEIKAWGRNKENWTIDHRIFPVDTSIEEHWEILNPILEETWPHESGAKMVISAFGVDTGYNTQQAYMWTKKWPTSRVIAIKGVDDLPMIFGAPTMVDVEVQRKRREKSRGRSRRVMRRSLMLWKVGTNRAKEQIYGWLNQEVPTKQELELRGGRYPTGWSHFPEHDDFDQEYFEQLTSEQLVPYKIRGRTVYKWEKKRDRNEILDLAVYNLAAAEFLGISSMTEEKWLRLEAHLGTQKAIGAAPEKKIRKKKDRDDSDGGLDVSIDIDLNL